MSMNLVWMSNNRKMSMDFEFQTPTELTYKVIDEKDKEKKYSLIEEYVNERFMDGDPDNDEYFKDMLDHIREKIFDEDFILSMC